ncbi:MAG: glycosyl transferase, partial [Leptolyngbyaceae cyanobacterium bins.59]|nr:glycosyl transferase [Leptolyngbyaceae cyanobacterium bins.59]
KEYPQAGAYGGPIHGQFETEPPPGFEKIQVFLAIRDHGQVPVRFDAENLRLPPAASLVVRRQAWLANVPPRPKLGGKLPGLLVQGDDYEPLMYLHKAGWEIWYNPTMHSYHQIPPQRFEREYLLRLARGCGLPTCHLKMIGASSTQQPGILLKTFAGNLNRAIRHWLNHRHHLETDLAAACEMAFHEASVMSVFFYLKRAMKLS